MKRSLLFGTLACGAAAIFLCTPTTQADPADVHPPTSGVGISPHNLNGFEGLVIENEEICRPCHTPHGAQDYQALWNHEIDGSKSYPLYNTFHTDTKYKDNYVGLDEASRLCLSCHDGAIAVDNYGGKTGGTHFVTGDKAVGNDGLGNDHPIGLTYPIQPDGTPGGSAHAYRDPDDPESNEGGIGTAKGVQLLTMPGGEKGVGCRSCHHSHNSSLGDFKRVPNTYSWLCSRCHLK